MVSFLKKFSYSFLANIFSAVTSILLIVVLPKVMSLQDYGVWQLFLFYISYAGFLHFGWIDGIYLRYGGQYYDDLEREIFSGQFVLFIMMLIVEFMFIFVFTSCDIILDKTLINILRLAAIYSIFYNIVTFVRYILQLSDKIKDYAKNVMLERIVTIILLLLCVLLGFTEHIDIIVVKIVSVFLVMLYSVFTIRDLLFYKNNNLSANLNETWENINVGSKLMLSNIAGMLILGVIRFGISQGWDIITFGKISLTLMASNFLMLFISAVSIVLFPLLKRVNEEKITEIYIILRQTLSFSLLGLLITYYPLSYLLKLWLPQYSDSLIFMGYLLPICIFESKMQMLVVTYLKSLRKEVFLLKINFISVIFAIFTTYITVVIFHNLHLTILAVVVNFTFRLFIGERFIEKFLSVDFLKDRCIELILVFAFIVVNIFSIQFGIIIYFSCYLLYLYCKKREIKLLLNKIKNKKL